MKMAKDTTKNMSEGSPMKLILGFAVPLLLGMLFQQVYNLVDTLIVGRYLGVDALAAVGSTGSINFLILGFCNGVCSGFSLPIAQRFGAGDHNGLRKYTGNSAVIASIIAVIFTVFTTVFCRGILELMNTPDNIIDLAYDYIVVIFIGIPAIMLYNILSGYIRALGDAVTPVIYLVIAAILNIGLDLVFIINFNMGVFGAALATVLSQGISGILCLIHIIFKFQILHISKEDLRLDKNYVHSLLQMGLPMGFSGFAVFAGVFEMVARAAVGIFLVPIFGFTAACFASPAAWVLADLFLIPAYFSCHKKLKQIMSRKTTI